MLELRELNQGYDVGVGAALHRIDLAHAAFRRAAGTQYFESKFIALFLGRKKCFFEGSVVNSAAVYKS